MLSVHPFVRCWLSFCCSLSFGLSNWQMLQIIKTWLFIIWINTVLIFLLFFLNIQGKKKENSTWNVTRTKETSLPQSLRRHLSLLGLYSLLCPFLSLSFYPVLNPCLYPDVYIYLKIQVLRQDKHIYTHIHIHTYWTRFLFYIGA